MINIELDGIYCPKCNDLHPTLNWHEKYDDYLTEDIWTESYLRALKRFSEKSSPQELHERYESNLKSLGIIISGNKEPCSICGEYTEFVNVETNHYVCSDECRYKDNEKTEFCLF